MIGQPVLLGLLLLTLDAPRGPAAGTSADRVTLRDGSVVLGLVTSAAAGPRGAVELVIRRAWAEKDPKLKARLEQWDRASEQATRPAVDQRRRRLLEWRRDRAGAAPGDPILAWIDGELRRLDAPGDQDKSILLSVRLPRNEMRAWDQSPAASGRLLRLAWLCDLPDSETMPLDDLKAALESRGYDVEAAGRGQPASLDRLLPPAQETESAWLARRAATEVAVEPELRFLRYQDMMIPDIKPGQPVGELNLATVLTELKGLSDPGARPDPQVEKLNSVAARGRIAVVVTRLAIQADLGGVTVESTLWIHTGARRWIPFGSRSATVRSDELGPGADQDIAADPRVQGAFQIVDSLGLGAILPELKQRSLQIGAATRRALEKVRSAFDQDIDRLMLPVLEPAREAAQPKPKAGNEPARPVNPPRGRPRRSVLGSPNH